MISDPENQHGLYIVKHPQFYASFARAAFAYKDKK